MIRPLKAAAFLAIAFCAATAISTASQSIRVIVFYEGKPVSNVQVVMKGVAKLEPFTSAMATGPNGALIPIRQYAKGKLCFTASDFQRHLNAPEECFDEPWPSSIDLTLRS